MKRVWNPSDNDKKILGILYENREGLRAKSINKWLGFKSSHIYKRLNILKDKGIVYNEFPVWKIANGQVDFCRNLLSSDKIFELHNIGYVIKLINIPKWWNPKGKKMRNRLMKLRG